MSAPTNFNSFLGNPRVVEILRRALDRERLPHALIFAGPPGVGKQTLAQLLALHLNCLALKGHEACGSCGSCRKILSGTHPDVRLVQPEGTFIKIDQVRAMIDEIAYQPFEGRYRVVIFDGADQMRKEAANCLLKTLEEPPSRSILILVTTRPYLLLETIRSRARVLQLGAIAEDVIERYLVAKSGRAPEDARLAAALSNGNLSAALAFHADRYKEIRRKALLFAGLLLHRGSFAEVSALIAAVAKDKDKDSFQAWIEMVSTLLQEVYYAQAAPRRMSQLDIAAEIAGLARSAPRAAVVAAIDAIKKLKSAIQQNVNRQLALEALFLAETI
jgi:DNA polymerase III subunit delta'